MHGPKLKYVSRLSRYLIAWKTQLRRLVEELSKVCYQVDTTSGKKTVSTVRALMSDIIRPASHSHKAYAQTTHENSQQTTQKCVIKNKMYICIARVITVMTSDSY